MPFVAVTKEQKDPREIVGEISRLVSESSDDAARTLRDIQFAPTRRMTREKSESNWQLIIFPPVSAEICLALDRAATLVQRRWDMVDMFQGFRSAAA